MKFCPKCGKKTEKLRDGLCSECSSESVELFEYHPKDITICVSCEKLFESGKQFSGSSRDNLIKDVIRKRISLNKDINNASLDLNLETSNKKIKHGVKININCSMRLRGKTGMKVELDEEYNLPIVLRYITCEKCSKKNTGYYEGILQIRHDDKNLVKKALDELENVMQVESKRSVFVTNIVEMKKGADAYVTSQRHIKDIGRKLFEKFGGEMKINEQLFSRDNLKSKHLYRVNLLLRLPDYEIGDVVFVKNKLIRIKRIRGHLVMGEELNQEKTITVNCKDEDVEMAAKKDNILVTTITKVKPHVEVMNPENYQSDILQNPNKIKSEKIGSKVNVITYKGIWAV